MRYDPHDDFDGSCMAPGCHKEIPLPEGRPRRSSRAGEQAPGTDGRTTRDQRRTCSPRCRTALSRARREKPRPLVICTLCGQPFKQEGRGRRTVCPYSGADEFCQGLQDDAEDANAMRLAELGEAVCQGPDCGAPVPYKGRGRPPRYCSARCRTRTYRAQKGA